MNYIPLYVKSSYSMLSSLCDIKKLVSKCAQLKIEAIAITDRNMYGTMEFYKECKKNNIKPILGLEVLIDGEIILLYAKNYSGYQNLTRITFIIESTGLDIDSLREYSDNLICITKNKVLYDKLKDIYNDIFIGYSSIDEKCRNGVFINEVNVIEKEDINYLKYLYLIKEGKKESELKDFSVNYNSHLSYYLDDYNTQKKIADMCDVTFSNNHNLMPKYSDDPSFNSKEFLFELCKKGLIKRLNNKVTSKYYDRLIYELGIIDSMGFNDYFLVVWDFVKFSRKNNILIGSGRGSAAGSLVSYSLGITEVDPIKYDLLFERFLNPERISMPDIDIDFESMNRSRVVDYVISKYGKKRVVPIITYTTLASKQVIRDVGRILNIDSKKIDGMAKFIGFNMTLDEASNNEDFKRYVSLNNLKELLNISLKLEGLKRQISIHAAGMIISNLELDSYIPIYKYENNYISGFSMEHLEELGLLKMDFLGIKNLTLIDNVIKSIGNIKFNDIPLDDKDTLDIFKNAYTEGIFQFESSGMKGFLKKLKPSSFDDIVAAIALFRPGPAQNIDSYIRRKHGEEKVTYIHDDLEEILKPTYGIIIYQEQIMQIANKMAGYSFASADVLRSAMSKKKKDILIKEEEKFISGCLNKGYDINLAKEVYELIKKFANYGFNKSHSVGYSMIAFRMAYLKVHYKTHFMSALLTNSIGEESKTKEYIDECRNLNIEIKKPSINYSDYEYKIEGDAIRFSLSAIKNVGISACKDIIRIRTEKKFVDFFDFVGRTYGIAVNRKVIESLIDSDSFLEFGYNHNTLYNNIDQAINYAELYKGLDESLIEKPIMNSVIEFSKEELSKKEYNVFGFYLSNHPVTIYRTKYKNIVYSNDIKDNFDKLVDMVLYVDKVKEITTKNKDKMAFLTCSDEFGNIELVLFPNIFETINSIKTSNIIYIRGRVEKRMSNFHVVVKHLEKL